MAERSENNFDFLRLVFSSAVILSHSFPLTGKDEFFASITNGQLGFGSLSVDIFFILSGYLIFTSLKYSKTIKNYIWKRVLRLYPALIILMLISLIILPFFYKGNSIFSEKEYWTYLPNNLSLYKVQYFINGIFESNPYPKAINGSLWSLSYEFTMYIVLVLLFPFKKSKYIFHIVLLCFIASYSLYIFKPNFLSKLFNYIYLDTKELYRLSTYFLAGSLLYFVKFEKFNNLYTRISLLILLFLSLYFTQFKVVAPLTLPVLILLVGTLKTKYISSIGEKFGDISYGVYIYGFLVQQILMNYLNLNVLELTIYSIIITYFLAYLSWHYVEKPMQKYKNLV
ncbi:Peptidoglycan/LPS O-acetylase OafA/YrhL, contains acyltransferase and SGNH-hydrolase domains [Chishuiella changwenlii]|uniref:Acyltransferase n=1 Tax=Chishuiella changwenlii TaxID=1434701 RepID=A0A1M6TXV5_9FLAO|nr:acyltransferase [Chishuiella changwenlii]GGF11632.1 acyltransferase [Chishuiella changwenlii]SHK61741.1 Peptidoglycan/LPS O-acetylase OafA/YrhL, contains acyltransferase and SGNH-hydrolase domains [Chishuiella changwenlii]